MTPGFFTLHQDIPREGPGDPVSLDWALGVAGVPPDGQVLDAGCGPGPDVPALLARVPNGHVTAMDTHGPFLSALRRAHGEDPRLTVVKGDMAAPAGTYDLIWCAGAAYIIGVTEALIGWRWALAEGGAVAFSDLVFLDPEPSEAVRALGDAYPDMGMPGDLEAKIDDAGYDLLGMMILPDEAWEAYYGPLEKRVRELKPFAEGDLAEAIAEAEAEIALWRGHRDEFGYALAVARPR